MFKVYNYKILNNFLTPRNDINKNKTNTFFHIMYKGIDI